MKKLAYDIGIRGCGVYIVGVIGIRYASYSLLPPSYRGASGTRVLAITNVLFLSKRIDTVSRER